MKKSIKKMVFPFFTSLLLFNCSKEIEFEETLQYQSNVQQTKVNFEEFKANSLAYSTFEEVRKQQYCLSTTTGKTSLQDFTVDYNSGVKLTYKNLESYTFFIQRNKNAHKLENLVVYKKNDQKYYAKILSYNLTPQERNDLKQNKLQRIQNPIETEFLGEYELTNKAAGNCGSITITYFKPCASKEKHSYEKGNANECSLTGDQAPKMEVTTLDIPCIDQETQSGGGTTPTDSVLSYFNINGGGGNTIGGNYTAPPDFPNSNTPDGAYENGLSIPTGESTSTGADTSAQDPKADALNKMTNAPEVKKEYESL